MDILEAEFWGVLDCIWNSDRPLVFTHVVLTNTLSVSRARDIWSRVTQSMDLWERGIHAGLVGGT